MSDFALSVKMSVIKSELSLRSTCMCFVQDRALMLLRCVAAYATHFAIDGASASDCREFHFSASTAFGAWR